MRAACFEKHSLNLRSQTNQPTNNLSLPLFDYYFELNCFWSKQGSQNELRASEKPKVLCLPNVEVATKQRLRSDRAELQLGSGLDLTINQPPS